MGDPLRLGSPARSGRCRVTRRHRVPRRLGNHFLKARLTALLPEGTRTRLILLGLTALLFVGCRAINPWQPRSGAPGSGWAGWNDQGAYLLAAHGWAAHLPSPPASQTYEPGYPILGGMFVHLVPNDPFLLPDLVGVLAACWWFGLIARAVLGNRPWSRETGLVVFAATSLVDPRAAVLWTTPWTTTPTIALTFGALASGLSALALPRARTAFAAALASGLVAAIRPGDLPLVLPATALALLFTGLQCGSALRLRLLASFVLGAVFGLGTALVLHLSVWGPQPSPYMTASAAVGFEWRLLPLRWVLLMDGAAPETAGTGIAYAFPYLLLGIPALVVFALAGTRDAHRRAPHVVLGCYALLSLVEFLSYRDLHPTGLWRFFNVHYFKWLFPLGGLYVVLLCREMIAKRRGAVAATVAASILMFSWFPALKRKPFQDAIVTSSRQVMLPQGLPDVADAGVAATHACVLG